MELTKQTLSRRYPNVKRITIKYELLVGSSFSENMKGTITLTPSDEYSVIIPCTNNTCTKKYIDIAEEVSTHIIRKETSFEVFAMCEGDESDKPRARRCMTTVTCSCQVQYLS